MSSDFSSITETPGLLLSPEQFARFLHRYAFALRESELLGNPARMLEVGCGTGSGLAAWREAGREVTGLEYVKSSLHVARANLGEGIPLVCGDAQTLPFASGSFDAIASFEVIYYLQDQPALLRECRRVLAPGGKLILCWSNPEWESFVPGKQSLHYPTMAEAATLLRDAGFGTGHFYGAFATSQTSTKAKWVNRIRQTVVRSGLSAVFEKVATPLMRAAYGELTPLPARLSLGELESFAFHIAPLAATSHDHIHRVLYAVAQPSV
jgi:ubiquinone/menaquinone biosynthesis C-methylase UbiE